MNGEPEIQSAFGRRPAALRRALEQAAGALSHAGIQSARLDAEVLLADALGVTRERLYLDYDAPLAADRQERFHSLIARRCRREPVAYLTGRREFWSLDFLVTPAVLVPRPETELLVETAVGMIGEAPTLDLGFRILELGTGSGAIAVSLAREKPAAELWATDISPEAIEVARANASRHGVAHKIHLCAGDLFEPVHDRRGFFQMIVSNPPYVRSDEFDRLPRDVRDFEPRAALDGGPDGLDFYRRIVRAGRLYLASSGLVLFEIGEDMADEVVRLFADAGCFTLARVYQDYSGRDRVISARKLT
jgi:release factor glutamine methyltransferase